MTSYSYDALGHLLGVTNPLNQATSYTYDPNGNLLTISDANGHTTNFTYDANNQQMKKTWPDGSFETFVYDAVGNRTNASFGGQAVTYNNLDHLTSAGTTQYSYDGRRNLTQITATSRVTKYTYNAANQLVSTTEPDGTSASYLYDADR